MINDSKTELIILSSPGQRKHIKPAALCIGEDEIEATHSARNLGVIFDELMNMDAHVKKICQACHFHLKNLSSIRHVLTQDTAIKVAHAFITSRLDNGNSMLYGITKSNLAKLQRIQNNVARIVTKTKKYDHISGVLKDLHWLPIKQRIEYKIILLTFKAMNGLAPILNYLTDLLHPSVPSRCLRSSNKNLLDIPTTRLKSYGDRAFSKAAPVLWNGLPQHLRDPMQFDVFKTKLKSHLFMEAYDDNN